MNTSSSANSSFPDALPVGTTLRNGDFAIEGVLGQGGFGITYRATDRGLNRIAAIKEFFLQGSQRKDKQVESGNQSASEFQNSRAGFLEEARTLARFDHNNIVNVYTIFEENNTAYMVMEYVAGASLSNMVEKRGALSPDTAIPIIRQVGEAVEAVHRAGMLHLDIKPDNAIVDSSIPSLRVVLLDFGLTRKLETAGGYGTTRLDALARFGTPGYAPPEQYSQRAQTGVTTDVYALAATLYFLLTGQVPPDSVERASGAALPNPRSLNPAISISIANAIISGMALDPQTRPQNVRAWLDALEMPAAPQRSTPSVPPLTAPRRPRTDYDDDNRVITPRQQQRHDDDDGKVETVEEIFDQLFGGQDPFSNRPARRRRPNPFQVPRPMPQQQQPNNPFQQPGLRLVPGCNCGCGCLTMVVMALFFLFNFFGAILSSIDF